MRLLARLLCRLGWHRFCHHRAAPPAEALALAARQRELLARAEALGVRVDVVAGRVRDGDR